MIKHEFEPCKEVELIGALTLIEQDELDGKRMEIEKWLNMFVFIITLEEKRDSMSERYYQEHSFYTSVVFDGYSVFSQSPKVADTAISLADSYAVLDKRISKLKAQYKRFKQYEGLYPVNDLERLNSDRINAVFDVIQEIKQLKTTNN